MTHHYLFPLLAFAVSAGLFTIMPGLDTVMVLRTAATEGRRGGAGAIVGIAVGLALWGVSAVLGLTALLAASATAFTVVKCVGAVYLAWMGIGMLLRPRSKLVRQEDSAVCEEEGKSPFWSGFRRGLLTDILNPKAGIFVITFFPQFIPQHVDVTIFTLLQALIQVLLSLLWTSLLVLVTVPLERFFNRPTIMRRIDRLAGGVFLALSAKLFMTHSPS